MATARNNEESSTEEEMQGGELVDFLDMRPSDIGLYGVLEMNPRWEQYAISLGLTIEQTKYYHEQQQEALRGLLAMKHWRDGRCGSSYPGTWKFLLDVIKNCLGPVVADELRDKITANKPWTITGQIGDVTEGEPECISKLKEFYLRDNVIQDDLLEMSPGLQYIPLSYVKVEKEKKERPESVQYDDMIRTVAQGSKCILLQGNPGSGKTTTLRKICHDFAKGGLPPEIKMVIRVILGDMEKGSEMKDLLTTCIDETHQDLIKDIGSYAEEVNGEGVLFLLDGFDELARDLQKQSLIVNILNGKAYPKSSCIITSRPSATAQLPPQAVQLMDCIETQGFTLGRMKQFIDRWFQTRPGTGKKLTGVIRHNPKLRDICLNPLIVLIACTIASEEQMLPDRMTELIKSFMCLLGNVHLQKNDKEPSIQEWEDLEDQCSSFMQLTDLALHGFLKGQYTFKDQDASLPHCPSKLNHMGLFVVTSQKKSGVAVKSYRFFHLVVQEFLSTYALSLRSLEDQTTFWKENLVKSPNTDTEEEEEEEVESLYVNRRFETLFQFYAGITRLQDVGIQQLLFNMVDTDQGLVLNCTSVACELFMVIYESQNVDLVNQLFSLYKPSVTIEGIKSSDFQALKWCLQQFIFSSLSIDCDYWGNDEQKIVKQIFDTRKENLEDIHWKQLYECDGAFVLQTIGACTKLKVLVLDGWIKFSTRSFLNVLNQSTSLQTLSLREVLLSDMDMETVVEDVSRGIQQLEYLSNVKLVKCCGELTRGVVEGLIDHKCISKFELEGLDEDIHIPQQSLVKFFKSTSLQTLSLEGVQLSDMDAETVVGDISRSIQQHKNLSDVTLVQCCGKLTRGVVEGLTDHTCISKLKAEGWGKDICISQQSFVKLLNKSTSLQTLSLRRVQLSDMDVETVISDISRGIQHLEDLSHVVLMECCAELTRGVVDGIVENQYIQTFALQTAGSVLCAEEELIQKSLENTNNYSKNLKDLNLTLKVVSSHCMASIVCGCFQSRTVEKIKINADCVEEDTADGVDGELLTRLESAIRDNITMRELELQYFGSNSPLPDNIAKAVLKGAVRNKGLRRMIISVPDTEELHKLVDEVEQMNKEFRLDVWYRRLRSSVKYRKSQSQPTPSIWSTLQAQPPIPVQFHPLVYRPGFSPSILGRGVAPPSTPPKKQHSLEDVD